MQKGAEKPIVIKRVRKTQAAHHGGGWKVAFADFATGMMAFFLLMWLVNMVPKETQAGISEYFQEFSLADTTWKENVQAAVEKVVLADEGEEAKQVIKTKVDKVIVEKLMELKDQTLVEITPDGVRIQLMDKEGNEMFKSGSADATAPAKKFLRHMAGVVNSLPNKVVIEGHTDASQFAGGKTTNWELSTQRASSARRILEQNGLNPDRISRVIGYADTDPIVKDNPYDHQNRRISLTVLSGKKKESPAAASAPAATH